MLQAPQRPTSGVDVQDVVIEKYIELGWVHPLMALKKSSELITVGARVTETAANTFTQATVDLQLNPLDQEVFVVQAIDMNVAPPDAIAATNTTTLAFLTSTSQTALPQFNDSVVLAAKELTIRAAGFVDGGVAFDTGIAETPPSQLDYIGIISTNDFFLQIEGTNNAVAKSMAVKVYGYRARADAATYAALVQSEVLSS